MNGISLTSRMKEMLSLDVIKDNGKLRWLQKKLLSPSIMMRIRKFYSVALDMRKKKSTIRIMQWTRALKVRYIV